MKAVVLLTRSLEVGGAERQIVVLAHALQTQGYSVCVLAFYGGGALRPLLLDAGVDVQDLGKKGRWDLFSFLGRLFLWFRRTKPEVVYSWLPTSNTLAAVLGKASGVPRIVWGVRASNMDLTHYDWLSRIDFQVTRYAASLADKIVCNSQMGLDFHKLQGYPVNKMCVIENGIDTDVYFFDSRGRNRVRQEWEVADDVLLIGLVARLDPMKDHETFLRAASSLEYQSKEVRFVFIGENDNAYGKRMRELSESLAIKDRIIWAGVRSDLAATYSALDVVTSCSITEGFSNVIAEAMACERLCVVTDVGDSRRIVGEHGWVVQGSSPETLVRSWIKVLSVQDDVRQAMGKKARERIEKNFSVEKMVRKTLDVLNV